MGGVCSGQSIPRKVLLTGPRGSGKTTLLYFWCRNILTDTVPTESFNVETVTGLRRGPLLIWDVTDTVRRRQFYHGTEAIVYVFEGSEQTNMAVVNTDLNTLLSDRDLHNLPLLLVISKLDLTDLTVETVEKSLDIASVTLEINYTCVGVTKDNSVTYREALQKLCNIIQIDSSV